MDNSNNLENRQDLLQQSPSYTIYLPIFSSSIIVFYAGVYILRYLCWRIKQRRRKVRLLEYEKLRWVWHQKQLRQRYQSKTEKSNTDIDDGDNDNDEKYPYRKLSTSSTSLSVTTINENGNEDETKIKAKRNQHQNHQNKCDYGDDSGHCRESSLVLTIPTPAYQPSHDHHDHSPPKPRLTNQKTTQLHHYHHQHQHQSSLSSSASSSSTRKASSPGHQGSFYSSSSSTTTLACSCIQQHRGKKENNPGTPPDLTSSPTILSFSSPTSPSSSLKEAPDLFYHNQEEGKENPNHKDRSHTPSFVSLYDKKKASRTLTTPTHTTTHKKPKAAKSSSSSSSPHTCWSFYDTKAKRTRMIWKWSVAMGYCQYDHAKIITSIIDQLDPPPSLC